MKTQIIQVSQTDRYIEPSQARERPPTPYEDLLGDALERAFAAGIHDLEPLVAALNRSGPLGPNGQAWTTESFELEMARLGH